jgi:pimeloyl-ACP methyl ester carboxylesterase
MNQIEKLIYNLRRFLPFIAPGEIYRATRSWADKNFHKIIYWNEVNKGGHFAAWEEPQLFTEELRAAFKSLRN